MTAATLTPFANAYDCENSPKISRIDLLDWLLPHCEPEAASLMYPQGDELGIGWIYEAAEIDRAITTWRDGRLELQTFATRNQEGKAYSIRRPNRLGLVAHRGKMVFRFCIDLDDHEGGICNVGLVDQMDRFLGAKALRFKSKSGRGYHCFYSLAEPMTVADFISWSKAWEFNRAGQPECFPKTEKLSQFWLPNEPNEKGGDTHVGGDFDSCIVRELPTAPSPPLARQPKPRRSNASAIDDKPGTAFAKSTTPWSEIIGGGAVCVRELDGKAYWRRPGKSGGSISATTGFCRADDGREYLYVFTNNWAPFQPNEAYDKFAAYTLLSHNGDFKAAARALGAKGWGKRMNGHANGKINGKAVHEVRDDTPPTNCEPEADATEPDCSRHADAMGRPVIKISCEEHEVNAAAVEALANDSTIFQRGGLLVRVNRDDSPAAAGIRRPLSPRIEAIPREILRERMTAVATWVSVRETEDGVQETRAHPPAWCVSAVHARGSWEKVRHLEAVVEYPVMRPDGTILQTPGYDAATGLLLEPAGTIPKIPRTPSKADADKARDRILEIVADFPFASPMHRAAWFAALLTPIARFAFTGPAPLFLVDANVRAAGKGLLLDLIALIVTGLRFTIATYTNDEDELRKRITSIVLGGDRLVLFDNLDGRFGNAVLDAALTGTSWRDRMLGVNRMVEAPMYMTWFATGNNVIIGADTARRICHIRLESPEERPENRSGFKHTDLRDHVRTHRGELLTAALTILRAHAVAGRPGQNLPVWGSFENWSSVVRAAVVWVGLPDPGDTRTVLQEQADVSASAMGLLLESLKAIDPERRGRTTAELIELAKLDGNQELRDAVESLAGKLDSRILGNKLRTYRRRIFAGLYLDRAGEAHRATRWAAFEAAEFSTGPKMTPQTRYTHPKPAGEDECDECDESFLPGEKIAGTEFGPYANRF